MRTAKNIVVLKINLEFKLFTLRESRRGRLEAGGRETGRSVYRKHPTPEFWKPGTPERHGVNGNEMESNGMEWYGKQWNVMEWNGIVWNGMEWNRINGRDRNGTELNGME